MLSPETLWAFATIAELGHFARAADRLGVAQSVVSKRLKRLEDQIGARLIERGKRNRICLTRAGELFLPEALAGLAALDRTEQLGRSFARGTAGPLRIGYVFSAIMTGVLPSLIRTLRVHLPEIEVRPVALETPEQLAALGDGKIDIGLVRPRPAYPHRAVATIVHSEDVVVALSASHPLAQKDSLLAREIVANRVIVPQFHEEVGLIDVIRGVAKAAGAPLPAIEMTTDFITAAALAAAGTGIAIAPRSLTRLNLEGLCFREIADHRARMDLVLISRPDIPAAIHQALTLSPEKGGPA